MAAVSDGLSRRLVASVSGSQFRGGYFKKFFPQVRFTDGEYVRIQEEFSTARVASFVNPDAVAEGTERLDWGQKDFKLPTVQDLQVITPSDIANIVLGTTEFIPKTLDEKSKAHVSKTTAEQRKMVDLAFELMSMEAMQFGKVTVIGKGENRVIDFAPDPIQTIDLGVIDPTKYIGGANFDVIELFDNARQVASQMGRELEEFICSPEDMIIVVKKLRDEKEYEFRKVDRGTLKTKDETSTNGTVYEGTYKNIDLRSATGYYQDANKVAKRGFAPKRAIFALTNPSNTTCFGDTPDFRSILSKDGASYTKDNTGYKTAMTLSGKNLQIEAIQTLAPMLSDTKSVVMIQTRA